MTTVADFSERLPLPPLRDAINDLDVLMAGEAQVDEPLAVEQPRGLFQQRDPLAGCSRSGRRRQKRSRRCVLR